MREHQGKLYFPHSTRLQSVDTVTGDRSTITSVSFFPTCIDVQHGFVALGGQRGELYVYNLTTSNTIYAGRICSSVVNALQICYINNTLTLVCSSNDSHISMFSIPTMSLVTTIGFPFPVNHTTVSPSGNMLVTVGDHNQVNLYSNSGGRWSKVYGTNAFTDAGMSTDWNSSGFLYAAASQDGTAVLSDVRNLNQYTKIKSFRPYGVADSILGSFRSVKFSKHGVVDLLVLAQHRSYVIANDTRSFHEGAVLEVGNGGVELAGVCFGQFDRNLYIATEDDINKIGIDVPSRLRSAEFECL
ncbi:hypothetical protein P9112_004775 [Eukaryota sp. TZLM1-RC]